MNCPHCNESVDYILAHDCPQIVTPPTGPSPEAPRCPRVIHPMKKTKYPKTLKLGVTTTQSKWIKQQAFTRVLSEAQVVRAAIDHARGCVTVSK